MNKFQEDDLKKIFGTNLKTIREKRGISQAKHTKIVGIDRALIVKAEKGQRVLRLANFLTFAHALNTTPEQLLDGWQKIFEEE